MTASRLEDVRESDSAAPARTLGDVLYANPRSVPVPEDEWVRLVRAVAEGDAAALLALYDRTRRPVFTLLLQMTSSREIAEELTLEVYRDVLRQARLYRASEVPVAGWIMGRARSAAIARLRSDQRRNHREPSSRSLIAIDVPEHRNILELRDQARQLREALARLEWDEREAIEAVYFDALTCEDAAAHLDCSMAELRARLRIGLDKLELALLSAGRSQARVCGSDGALIYDYALHAVPASDLPRVRAHLSTCAHCSRKAEALEAVVDFFVSWPTDLLRPAESLRGRLAKHGAGGTGRKRSRPRPRSRAVPPWAEQAWEAVAPDISCQFLSADGERGIVSMLVRLAPGGQYPGHVHASTEELFLLDGQLWIDDRKLYPGDYNRAEPGTRDLRVWTQNGCTCLLITSARDTLL